MKTISGFYDSGVQVNSMPTPSPIGKTLSSLLLNHQTVLWLLTTFFCITLKFNEKSQAWQGAGGENTALEMTKRI